MPKKPELVFNTPAELEAFKKQCIQEELAQFTPEMIRERVRQVININVEQLIGSLMGFRFDRWEGWKIDRYFSARNNPLEKELIQHTMPQLRKALDETEFTITKSMRASLLQMYRHHFPQRVEELVREKAAEDARRFVESGLDHIPESE